MSATAVHPTFALALPAILESELFSDIDREFARFIARTTTQAPPEVLIAAALVSRARGDGHTCLDLKSTAGTELRSASPETGIVQLPKLPAWRQALSGPSAVGKPGDFTPLILDAGGRLYLHRYWLYEQKLGKSILERSSAAPAIPEQTQIETILDRLNLSAAQLNSEQRRAVLTAIERRFCVITGGPGTGKTRTAAYLLTAHLQRRTDKPPRIALCAPTGKAAARLQESIRTFKALLSLSLDNLDALPSESFTLHRLLGIHPLTNQPRHHREHPLPFDVIVVDEASMVDLALMAKLFDAALPTAHLVLIGDKDQLSSVEAGAVLGDICFGVTGTNASSHPSLASCIVQLDRSHRFSDESGIRELSHAINRGSIKEAIQMLQQYDFGRPGLRGRPLPNPEACRHSIARHCLDVFSTLATETEPARALQQFAGFRILCATRRGPYGVESINQFLDQTFAAERSGAAMRSPHYAGRPILIRRNDPNLKLFNGDLGILLPERGSGALRAWFADDRGTVRSVLPARLPEHETAYAMTIHKSQGSEFDRVLMILPDRDTPLLTRELLYTGVTRARSAVEVWYDEEILRQAIERRITRSSGLRDALWPTK